MPKTVAPEYEKYLYMGGLALLTGYVLSIDAEDDTFYVANNKNLTMTYNAVSRSFAALAVKRTTIKSEEGTILNELEIGLDNADLAFKTNVMLGKYSNRRCKIVMMFAQKGATSALGYMDLFEGFIDEPKGDEHWVTFQVRPFSIFEREYPNRIFQVGCNWTFCDAQCGLDISSFYVNTSLSVESDGQTLVCAHGHAANYYVPGFVQITSGTYNGWYRPILSNDTSSLIVRVPFGIVIPNGTTVRVTKLCARNPVACIDVFNNYDEYGGFPHTPKAPLL